MAFLDVMPRASRATSASASPSSAYDQRRMPPKAGPSVMSCRAKMANNPVFASRRISIR